MTGRLHEFFVTVMIDLKLYIQELEKGKYIRTDTYIAHALINPHGVYVLLLTNKRIFYIKKVDIFGGWGVSISTLYKSFLFYVSGNRQDKQWIVTFKDTSELIS